MEAFPIQFCRGIRSYWKSRKYQRLQGSNSSVKRTGKVTRFGGPRGSSRRAFKIRSFFRIRFRMPSPARIFARIRDAYMDAMLGLAGRGSSLSASVGPESLVGRRIPKARPVRAAPGEFERRMILEICRSVAESREFAAYKTE